MSDKLADFVRAGQAAQAVVDKLTAPAWPSIAEISVDALAIGGRVGSIIRLLDDAAAHRAHRRHTNAASLEQLARAQVRQLGKELDAHFMRFTTTVAGSRYACTCGWELRGAELVAYLENARSTPASVKCKNCGGVAVRRTS